MTVFWGFRCFIIGYNFMLREVAFLPIPFQSIQSQYRAFRLEQRPAQANFTEQFPQVSDLQLTPNGVKKRNQNLRQSHSTPVYLYHHPTSTHRISRLQKHYTPRSSCHPQNYRLDIHTELQVYSPHLALFDTSVHVYSKSLVPECESSELEILTFAVGSETRY